MTDKAKLAVAEQHVREAERIVARQRITRLRSQGLEIIEAEQTLEIFEQSLRAFRRHRDSILRDLGREAS